ncbi:uncharacterized protein BDW43DRAFT_315603 [Aspergillus alliaceus]|uniref:uncharacterized protein n=1 Tax=Petromyces alliaceus TaxID=209559 RepID=UPI0012A43E8A|nr:uncharacterized protein BDW43DRAFT_315603 [Aspergillus alliaceus]KAB8228838.1 hypothetical protein BDW43DRAFT_315603 [Aspergillus alliaceus]
MALLIERFGDAIDIPDKVPQAAAQNHGVGEKVMTIILERYGDTVKVTEEVVKAAVTLECREQADVALDTTHEQLPDKPESWEKLTPKYPLGCKRVVVSDFFFYPALNLPNVELEARPIHNISNHTVRVVGTGGQPEDADSHYDLVVHSTGFRTKLFLYPMKIYGRNDRALHEM